MHTYHTSRSSLWQVLVAFAGAIWMLWEVARSLLGEATALGRVEYGVLLLAFFGGASVWHYRRWKATRDPASDALPA